MKKAKNKSKKVDSYKIAKIIQKYAALNNTFVTINKLKKNHYQLEIFFKYD